MNSIGVTGAAGYVGSALVQALREIGTQVIELRRSVGPRTDGTRPFKLEDNPAPGSFAGIDTLVHCAYDFKAHGWEDIFVVNVEGTRRLFAAAAAEGVKRFILVSTISAFPGCRSLYGRAKLEMELAAGRYGAMIIRPGLVFGNPPGGMVAALAKLLTLPGLVPLVGDGRYPLYMAHKDDLCRLLVRVAGQPTAGLEGRPVVAAYCPAYTLREIMGKLAAARSHRPRFLPIPAGAIDWGLGLAESCGFRLRLRRDSLASLLNPDPAPDFGPLRRLGLEFRPFI